MKILISESQLQNIITPYHINHGINDKKRLKLIKEQWRNLSYKDQKLVIDIHNVLHPEHNKTINEARWWNTIGDIVGIFDPTGVVDIINGLDYFRQGDKLFGILSLISAVPYVGDLVGKPIIGMMKLGGESVKILRAAKTSTEFATAGKQIPLFGKLLNRFGEIGPKLMSMLKKLVGKVPGLRGMITALEEWITMFSKASKEYKLSTKTVMKNGKPLYKFGVQAGQQILKPVEKINFLKSIAQILKPGSEGLKTFRNYKTLSPNLWNKYAIGGVGRVWGNRSTRSLMRRTKWYLRFLDYIGVHNFIGPDQLDTSMGSQNVITKMNEFVNTPESTQAYNEDMSNIGNIQPTQPETSGGGFNLGSLLGGSTSPETMNLLKMMATSAI